MSSHSESGASGAEQVVELDSALWRRLLTGDDEEAFFESWLALQARQLPNALNAVLLVIQDDGRIRPVSYWPKGASPGVGAIKAAQSAVKRKVGVVRRGEGGEGGSSFAYPVMLEGDVAAVGAFTLTESNDVDLQSALRRVQWGAAWIEQHLAGKLSENLTQAAERLALALDVAAIALEHDSAGAAALAATTQLATKLGATRVSLGRRRLGGSRLLSVSHSPQISRRQNLARAIADAMDEAIDQGRVLIWPQDANDHFVMHKHQELAKRHGAGGPVVTVPLITEDNVTGAICVEFPTDREVHPVDVDMIENAGTIASQVLELRRLDERWLVTKVLSTLRNQLGRLLGRGYLGRKLFFLALMGAAVFFYYYKVDFRVPARASLEGEVQRVVSAPFDGYIAEDFARPGDVVKQGDLLARLDDGELQLELAAWENRRAQYEAERQRALAERDIAGANVYNAQISEANVQIELIQRQIGWADIRAPFDGMVLSGDLSQGLGTGVGLGDPLFQIAPLSSYRVVLNVDEEDISRIDTGQPGELLLASRPDRPLAFKVSKLTAVTNPENGRNYFRVEALLDSAPENLRPGMKGTARIRTGPERLIWIWTRRAENWLRLTIWKWSP